MLQFCSFLKTFDVEKKFGLKITDVLGNGRKGEEPRIIKLLLCTWDRSRTLCYDIWEIDMSNTIEHNTRVHPWTFLSVHLMWNGWKIRVCGEMKLGKNRDLRKGYDDESRPGSWLHRLIRFNP